MTYHVPACETGHYEADERCAMTDCPVILTADERSLLEMLADHPRTHEIMPNEVATIRGLLERTRGTHPIQCVCSVQTGCTSG